MFPETIQIALYFTPMKKENTLHSSWKVTFRIYLVTSTYVPDQTSQWFSQPEEHASLQLYDISGLICPAEPNSAPSLFFSSFFLLTALFLLSVSVSP